MRVQVAFLLACAMLLSARESHAQSYDRCGFIVPGFACWYFEDELGGKYTVDLSQIEYGPWETFRLQGTVIDEVTCISTSGTIQNPVALPCPSGVEYCFGDGGDQAGCTPCPCSNTTPVGSGSGCTNSSGSGARLVATGAFGPIGDTTRIEVVGATPQTFGVLTVGDNALPQNPQNPCTGSDSGVLSSVLDGLRCVGGNFGRVGARATDSNGSIGVTNAGWGLPDGPQGGLLEGAGYGLGQTRRFQVFYRDNASAVCLTGQNTTQAVAITLEP